jgi:glycosyltransferase involved in cell wall biosynthesis
MPAITVVLPTYQRPELLTEALKSLVAQTFEDWEAVIVDGSPEGTPPPIDDARVRYFREGEHGVSGLVQARNFAVRASNSKYIAYLDDDEIYYPSKLEVMWNFLEQEAKGEMVYHDVVVAVVEPAGGSFRHVCVPRPHWHPPGDPNALIHKFLFIAGVQVMHTRDVFEKAGGFRDDAERGVFGGKYRDAGHRYDEDADLFRRMARLTRIERVPLQLAEYRVHGGNVNAWGIDYAEVVRARRLSKAYY